MNWLVQRIDADGDLIGEVEVVAENLPAAKRKATHIFDYRNQRSGFLLATTIPEEGFPAGYRIPYEQALARYRRANEELWGW